ncbi:hypothetical protein V8E54_005276 [Elaphomyces granulatus]
MYRKLPGGHFRALKKAWLDFVHDQKEKEGGQRYLPKAKRCHCGKSLTSYPHWPPSTYEEAVAQLRSLIGESFPHRMVGGGREDDIVGAAKLRKSASECRTSGSERGRLPCYLRTDIEGARNCERQLLFVRLWPAPGAGGLRQKREQLLFLFVNARSTTGERIDVEKVDVQIVALAPKDNFHQMAVSNTSLRIVIHE